jgi:hypothetical protein
MPGANPRGFKHQSKDKRPRGPKNPNNGRNPLPLDPKPCDHPWCVHDNPEEPHDCDGHPDAIRCNCKSPSCMGKHYCLGHGKYSTDWADKEARDAAQLTRRQYSLDGVNQQQPISRAHLTDKKYRFRSELPDSVNYRPLARAPSRQSFSSSDSAQPPTSKKSRNVISGATGGRSAELLNSVSANSVEQFLPAPQPEKPAWPGLQNENKDWKFAFEALAKSKGVDENSSYYQPITLNPAEPLLTAEQQKQARINAAIRRDRELRAEAAEIEAAIAADRLNCRAQEILSTSGRPLEFALNPIFPPDVPMPSANNSDVTMSTASSENKMAADDDISAERENELLKKQDDEMESN